MNPIPFPHSSENDLKRSQNLLMNHKVAQAELILRQSLEHQYDMSIFNELVAVYLDQKDHKAIKQLWQDYPSSTDDLIQSTSLAKSYIESQALMPYRSQSLLTLYSLKDHYADTELLSSINFAIERFRQIESLESILDTLNLSTDNPDDIFQQFTQKTNLSLQQILQYLRQSNHENLPALMQQLLLLESLDNYNKSFILEWFIQNQAPTDLELYWFGERIEVNTSKLPMLSETSQYLHGCEIFQDFFDQFDPHLAESTFDLFQYSARSFYPKLDEWRDYLPTWLNQLFQHQSSKSGTIQNDPTTAQHFSHILNDYAAFLLEQEATPPEGQ